MSDWFWWALILLAQSASFTWSSRAKNGASLAYNALASVASNGIWILSMFFVVDKLKAAHSFGQIVQVVVFYVVCTVAGSVFMHWASMEFLETGKRHVGARWK